MEVFTLRTALTIAGSDSSGGAGIQADLKTFAACGVFGMSVITAITAQNTCGVTNIRELDTEIIRDQIAAVYNDITVNAVKIGMLSNAAIIEVVAESLKHHGAQNIILDTVMISKSGSHLLNPNAIEVLKKVLIPMALVVTPNLYEASEIVGFSVEDQEDMKKAAKVIKSMGPSYVIIKGGHLTGNPCDLLYDGKDFTIFANERIDTIHTHGTGCTFSSAIAAALAKGLPLQEAVGFAKKFITTAIKHGFKLGKGVGPTHHFYELYSKAGLL
ncbi:Hydroxymethylpyrimidine/phosphomethylpyrimidine kinase [bioreactor metagenome]|uniref:Hydroxymethylpyrimidine/phosphomethylpyrimidine kinase n=1 Tax=bioreactor metagenome TaxID=1076179 RepID=A0A644US38_9ZZZZ